MLHDVMQSWKIILGRYEKSRKSHKKFLGEKVRERWVQHGPCSRHIQRTHSVNYN